jgi:hypothetical protein
MTPETESLIDCALDEVRAELIAAYENFPDIRSAHEGVAIVEEEFLEFKDAAFWPHKQMNTYGNPTPEVEETEARQLAAMAIRYLVDVCYKEDTPR